MDVTADHLEYYLDRIHKFLTSDVKTQVFPSLNKNMEDVLVSLVEDVDYLKNGRFDDNCNSIADQISAVLERNKQVFNLSYGFDKDEQGKKVMVYKKIPVPIPTEPETLKLLRKPRNIQPSIKTDGSTRTKTVMSSFKTACLNSTLKFVKNDQRVLQYPDMSTEQAEFVKQMIEQSMASIETSESKTGFKGMYDSLTEALKIFGFKYDFKLRNAVPIHDDMKRLFFEKIPKINEINEEIEVKKLPKSVSTHSTSPLGDHKPNSNTNLRNSEIVHRQLEIIPESCYKMGNTEKVMEIHKNTPLPIPTSGKKKEKEIKVKNDTELNNNNNLPIGNQNKENKEILKNDFITKRDYSILNSQPLNKSKKTLKKLYHLITMIIELKSSFAESVFTRLRNFLSDSTKKDIVFKNLSTQEMNFLMEWEKVVQRLEIIGMFCVRGQMLLYEINTLNNQMSSKYQLKISTAESSVTFTKHPKQKQTNQQIKINKSEDIISISNTSSSSNNSSQSSKSLKKESEKLKEAKSVSEKWIKKHLSNIKDFINDEAQASLVIPGVTDPQMVFLMNLQKILGKTDAVEIYSRDIQKILSDIHQSVFQNALSFTLSINVTKVKKASGKTRNITFTKIPYSSTTLPKAKENKPKENVPAKSIPKGDGNKAANTPAKTRSSESPKKKEPSADKNKVQKTCSGKIINPVTSNKAPSIPKSASATSLRAGNTSAGVDRGRPNSAKSSLSLAQAKAKLIEGLSQPVNSEIGLKMMRIMGWEGGALGARGEGIVEPIMVSLDLGKRAGLGLKKPPSKQDTLTVITKLPDNITRESVAHSPNNMEFTDWILQTVMKMLQTSEVATELNFPSNIKQKKWNFVRNFVNTCNSRAKISYDRPSWTELGREIIDKISQTDYIVTACWGISKRNILFILSNSVYQPSDFDSKNWSSIVNIDNAKKTKQIDSKSGNKTLDHPANFRYYILELILKFCQKSKSSRGNIIKDIPLKVSMVAKQMSFINDLIRRLNSKSRASTDNKIEITIYEEVMSKMQGFNLEVDFPVAKSTDENRPPVYNTLRLHKLYDSQKAIPTEASDESKIEVQSVESINRLPNQEVIKDIETAKSVEHNSSNHVVTINEQDMLCVEFENKNLQNKLENVKKPSKAKDRTFTSDSFDEKYLFENLNESMNIPNALKDIETAKSVEHTSSNHVVTINRQDTCVEFENINLQNKLKNVKKASKAKDRTFTSDSFDEKYLFENLNESMNISNALKDIETAKSVEHTSSNHVVTINRQDTCVEFENINLQNKLKNVKKASKAKDRTFTSDSFDEKYLFENLNESMNIPNALTDSTTAPTDSKNLPTDKLIDKINNCVCSLKSNENYDWADKDGEMIEIDRPLLLESYKESYEKRNDKAIDTHNNRATVTEIDEENDKATISDNDKEIDMATIIENKGNDRARVTENDIRNDRAIIIEDDKRNGMATDSENESDREENTHNDTSMTAAYFDVDLNLQNQTINNLNTLASADSRMECAEHILKEFVEQTGRDLLLSKPNWSESETEDKENVNSKHIAYNIGKRFRSNNGTPENALKKCKYEFVKKISITPKNYPQSIINNKMAGEIQKSILTSIDYTDELPLLKCHGIQDGALSYSCHTEKSLDLIKNVVKLHNLQVTMTQEIEQVRYKMTIKINTFIEENVYTIFERLESYNKELNTKDWKVIKKNQTSDILVIYVDIDEESYRVIVKEKFTLNAGMDEARFSIEWI